MSKVYKVKHETWWDGDHENHCYNNDHLIAAGHGSAHSLEELCCSILLLEGVLKSNYYESDNEEDYLSLLELQALLGISSIRIDIE